ncbi:MAG: long-chain acyl-CoA synthetase [Bradymonadia bacterium]|jgi:long-chain acyl-CoA synthetase
MKRLSVVEQFAGKEVLLTGASGFVGKVWLVMMLSRVPSIKRIHILMRPNGDGDPNGTPDARSLARFGRIVNESPAFDPLRAEHGDGLSAFLQTKVRVHAGCLTDKNLGLDTHKLTSLAVIVHCAAVVDFEPDVRHACTTNIHGSLHAAELANTVGAGFVQVSTCFVAGKRDGVIAEEPVRVLPNGGRFDPEQEFADLTAAIEALEARHASDDFADELHDAAKLQIISKGREADEQSIARQSQRLRDTHLKKDWVSLGTSRAAERAWPNTYTYTKGIAEGLVAARYPDLKRTIFRPAVVESAMSFPFPGWNEGFNTCGPLAYLIGTWFKAMPGRENNPFDVCPVDFVAAGIAVAGAAVMADCAEPVYQGATTERNRLTVGRATELTGLGQRRFLRKHGETWKDRLIRSRADTTVFDEEHALSLGSVDWAMETAAMALRSLPKKAPSDWASKAKKAAFKLDRSRRALQRIEIMVDAFTPFTRDLRQSFASDALNKHDVLEPEFAWVPESINWRDYWLNIHMPGMRKWCFPLIDGEDPPRANPEHPVCLGISNSTTSSLSTAAE